MANAFFTGKREQFFRPLTHGDRECCAAVLRSLYDRIHGPNADYYKPFEENARRWYKEAQERVYFMNHTLVNPPVDRNKDIHEVDDIFIHAVKETDEGVVVTGAKLVATGSAFSNYNFVSYHGAMPIKK